MKKILVTAIGSMSADIVIKILHRNGYYVIGTDIYPKEWVVDAGNVDEFYNVPTVNEEEHYINRLTEICVEKKVDFIMPLTDAEIDVLNENRDKFENISVLCLSDYKTIHICRDKSMTADFLGKRRLCRVIPGYSNEDIENQKISFPVAAKPVDGRSSQGFRVFRINEAEEFYRFYDQVSDGGYLYQQYIAGNVVTVDVVRDRKSNRCVALARRELLRTLNGAGLSVQVFRDVILEKSCIDIAEALDITGCVNFEFIETEDKKRYFLECNPRFSGGVEFSVMSGYDFVTNHLRCFENREIEAIGEIREHYIARKYEEYITG